MKKFLAVLLAVAMVLSCLPMMASAATIPVWDMADGGSTRLKAYITGLEAGDMLTFYVNAEILEGTSLYVRNGSDKAVYAGGQDVYSGQHITSRGTTCTDGWYYIECKTTVAGTHDVFVDGVTNEWAKIAGIKVNGVAIDASRVTTATLSAESIEEPTLTGTPVAWPVPAAAIDSASITLTDSLAFKFYPTFSYVDNIEATSAQFVFADNSTKDVDFTYEVTGDGDDNTFARINKYQLVNSGDAYEDEMIAVSFGISLVPGETVSFDYKPLGYDIGDCEIRPTVSGSAKKNWRLYFNYGEDATLSTDSTTDLGYLPTNILNEDVGNGWYRLSFTVGAATTTGTDAGEIATANDSNNLWIRFYGAGVGKIDFALDNVTVGNNICTFPEGCVVSGQAAEKPNYTYKYDNSNDTFTFNRKEGKFYSADVSSGTISTPCFILDGITPQMINDQITCNIIYNDEVIGTKTASVADYLNNLKAEMPGTSYEDVADALLVYGGAAQVYTKYNTADLAAPFVSVSVASPAAAVVNNNDQSGDYKVKSAALHYSDAISIVFKVVLADPSDATVLVNGDAVEPELVSGDVYKVTTDAIMFSELLDGQTVEIEVGGDVIASATYYGVDSAAYKFGNDDDAYGHLVNALYGVAKAVAAL